jgi:hypothetical protein
VADKSPFYSHCGVPSHEKGSTRSKKFKAKVGTFYLPRGSSTSRPTAKMEPFNYRNNIPRHLLPMFKKGLKTSTDWEQFITKTVLSVEVKDADDYEDEVIKEEEDHNATMVDRDFEESSTIMSGMDEGEFEDIEIKFEWDYEELKDSNWAPMAWAHRKAFELLVDALKTTSKTSAKELRALECRMQTGHGPEDVKATAALQALVSKFGLVAEAVTCALDVGGLVDKDIEALQDDMNKFH